ncbi:hypothetical protein LY76DRAFT_408300 [Colletotrichum caudatum]|nr:hypothetical protein LY76DRAFT_408300 [Colletotrichum caudatum]
MYGPSLHGTRWRETSCGKPVECWPRGCAAGSVVHSHHRNMQSVTDRATKLFPPTSDQYTVGTLRLRFIVIVRHAGWATRTSDPIHESRTAMQDYVKEVRRIAGRESSAEEVVSLSLMYPVHLKIMQSNCLFWLLMRQPQDSILIPSSHPAANPSLIIQP